MDAVPLCYEENLIYLLSTNVIYIEGGTYEKSSFKIVKGKGLFSD